MALACAATLAATGCSAGGTKAGPTRPTVVLHLATPENPDAPYADDVRFFARRVRDLTDGEVDVRLDFEAIPWTPASEGKLFEMVQDGTTELALVPPRAFDTVGVTGFEALQAPMLIDSPELAGAVATSDLAGDLLDSLGEYGVVGLGLAYEGLRATARPERRPHPGGRLRVAADPRPQLQPLGPHHARPQSDPRPRRQPRQCDHG